MKNKLAQCYNITKLTAEEMDASIVDVKPKNTNTGPPISLDEIRKRIAELPEED